MKVTVCFGEVRVLVPCGAGDLLVRDLVREATHRYKKATGQGPESWVEVRALRASSGGILDPDDRVRDVADDRETLVAECTGSGIAAAQPLRHNGGDGASGSSVGTASPDMFRGGCGVGGSMRGGEPTDHGVEVGAAHSEEGGVGLQVRRGSEPTLHQDSLPVQPPLNDHTKRWSAAVVCRDDARHKQPPAPTDLQDSRLHASHPAHVPSPAQHFQRQTNRLSMQFSGPGSGVWLDAAERVQTISTKSLPRDSRKEPLGQDTAVSNQNHRVEDMLRWVSGVNGTGNGPQAVHERPLDRLSEVAVNGSRGESGGSEVAVGAGATRGGSGSGQLLSVALVKGERGLGFTITTRDNPTGGHAPIYIKNILPKGAAVMDGRLRAGDRLVSVNGTAVSGLAQQQVVSLLRNTPTDSTVTLLVERQRQHTQRVEPQQSPAKYTEKAVGTPESAIGVGHAKTPENGRVSAIVNALNKSGRIERNGKDDLNHNKSDGALQDALNSSNTVLGLRNRLILRLDVPVHDSEKAGLGISVKGKVTVGSDPQDLGIFIKSVLNGGAASRDGRLHTNDQLLNVNGVSLVGQSNAEAMETLRRALVHSRGNVHGNISLTIARRTESMDSLARWKDDTPPTDSSGNSTSETSTQHNTVIYNPAQDHDRDKQTDRQNNNRPLLQPPKLDNERINGKRHASIVTINNNTSWVSNQSDDSKGYTEREKPEHDSKRDSFEWSRLDGWNPVIDRLTGLRNESYYMATQTDAPGLTNGHGHLHGGARFAHMHLARSPPQHNVIIEEDSGGTVKTGSPTVNGGGVYESGSESAGETAFSRDAIGRRSMSEKRHAAVDAKTTDTYKKIKEQKAINAMQAVGPTLGMRKSSSLESLQTAVQEQQRQPIYSTRHQVQHTPLKHWLTDVHPNGTETMVRGSPQQSSLSHKKPSLLKSLSSMLRFGNKPKKPEEIYGRSAPGRASEKSLSREALERSHAHAERTLSERGQSERGHTEKGHSERYVERDHERRPSERGHTEKGHSERYVERDHERRPSERINMERRNDRVHDRLLGEPRVPEHTNHSRSGVSHAHARQSSADKMEERRGLYVQHAPPYRLPPSRISPPAHTMSQVMDGAWGATGHYVNYEEIQQNLNARREKLSEVQIGQMRRTVHAQRAKAEEESRRAGVGGGYHSQRSSSGATRPQSNYYEYESIQPHTVRQNKLHYH